ncbi:MAG: ABC transporter permease [Chloroflexi bacterium]|nr:ABC transporter permease [Chloroflexota bacterium]
MRTPILVIARRELAAQFRSPVAYILIAAFILIAGFLFANSVISSRQATVRPLFGALFTILLLFAPIITMRLLAEEARNGTMELLLTAPIRDFEIVLGKFLAGLGFFAVVLGVTLYFPFLLLVYGNPDVGGIVGTYLGALLFCATLTAIGLFASSLTQNQIVAAAISWAILLLLYLVDALSGVLGGTSSDVLRYVSLYPHFNDLTRGVIDTKDIVYFLSMTAAALFLTWRKVESRRWS